jgi:hypothetical protein
MKFKIVHVVQTALTAFLFITAALPRSPLLTAGQQVAVAVLGLCGVFSGSAVNSTLAPASAVTVTQVTGPEVRS